MIRFFFEKTRFRLKNPRITKRWIAQIAAEEHAKLDSLNYIFCTDEYLLAINKSHLNHNYYTDIITFDTSFGQSTISGDIYISIDRVTENALTLNEEFDQELHRVIIHGFLHLIGFSDKTKAEKTNMRKKEEACLSLRSST